MAKGRQVYLGSEKGLPAVLWRGAKLPLLRYVWVRHYGLRCGVLLLVRQPTCGTDMYM
jgi:hypothetical protein